MGRPLIDISGKIFGRWLVLSRDKMAPSGARKHPKWLCVCECGTFRSVYGTLLSSGTSKSCGCLQSELVASRNTTHGTYGTKHYWCWFGAQKRAAKILATPKWANMKEVRRIYACRPIGRHVDHIVPLVSPVVCGLHWEGNLQYLPARENLVKKNRMLDF